MKTIGIIPARYASSRFPGKPMVDIGGKSMIQRVYDQVRKTTGLNEVIVATDDERIYDHVQRFGGNVMMTATTHESGTDRCAEVINKVEGFDIAINIQGDEPFISPLQIERLLSCFQSVDTQIATLIKEIHDEEELWNTNTPKVVCNLTGEAIYFSRQTIPFVRREDQDKWRNSHQFYKHIGIYGYRTDILKELAKLDISSLERAESLEQLRWIENGYRIQTALTEHETLAVDTPEDLANILDRYFK
jgi:3-deoxy-manno-octulosonate cytidylyltransferase (CMP-KDO synthetase)